MLLLSLPLLFSTTQNKTATRRKTKPKHNVKPKRQKGKIPCFHFYSVIFWGTKRKRETNLERVERLKKLTKSGESLKARTPSLSLSVSTSKRLCLCVKLSQRFKLQCDVVSFWRCSPLIFIISTFPPSFLYLKKKKLPFLPNMFDEEKWKLFFFLIVKFYSFFSTNLKNY